VDGYNINLIDTPARRLHDRVERALASSTRRARLCGTSGVQSQS